MSKLKIPAKTRSILKVHSIPLIQTMLHTHYSNFPTTYGSQHYHQGSSPPTSIPRAMTQYPSASTLGRTFHAYLTAITKHTFQMLRMLMPPKMLEVLEVLSCPTNTSL